MKYDEAEVLRMAKISAVLSNNEIDRTLKIVLGSSSKKMFIDDYNYNEWEGTYLTKINKLLKEENYETAAILYSE